MTGWLVVNHFINAKKFLEINELLLLAAQRSGIELEVKTNLELALLSATDEVNIELDGEERWARPDFVLFWDKDVRLAKFLETMGLRLFNSARAIELCDDKSLTYLSLLKSGIRMPKTLPVPLVYHNTDWSENRFAKSAGEVLGYPLVVKESFGSFGEQVFLVNSYEELVSVMNKVGCKPMILQEFIGTSRGRDIRLNVVGDRVIAAMHRHSETGDFRANLTIGGKMSAYSPNERQAEMAIDAVRRLGLDFAGVDILFGEDDAPILCEVNSNAHFKNIYECTGVNAAEHIMKYIRRTLTYVSTTFMNHKT